MRRSRGRLIFALDATASREAIWDIAAQLQARMFEEAAKIGGLDVELIYFRAVPNSRLRRGSPIRTNLSVKWAR